MPNPSKLEAAVHGDAARPVWLRVGVLLDGASREPLRDAHVVYGAGGIAYVGAEAPPAEALRTGQTQPDVDLPGHTLLPGLIEAHAHLFLEGGETDGAKRAARLKQGRESLLDNARGRLERLVRLGILAVRDAGDKDGVGLALSRLSAGANRPVMPYVDSPGAALHRQGRYGGFMGRAVASGASLAQGVAERVAEGADRIKLIASGIISFKKGTVTDEPPFSTAEIAEVTAAARRFGRQTFAHASGAAGIERVIEGGIDSVEHGFFVTDEQLAKMRDRHTAWVPTFAPVQRQVEDAAAPGWDATLVVNLQRILDSHAASLRKAYEMGVVIVAGSDAGSFGVAHGFGFLRELELMERAGLPTIAVINSATGTSAGRLGYKEKFGQIRAGWRSRFILTEHSPLATVANLRRPKTVIYDGKAWEVAENIDAAGM